MNPKKSEFTVHNLKHKVQVDDLNCLKEQLLLELKEEIASPISQLGYIEQGPGLHGNQRWLTSDCHLKEWVMFSKVRDRYNYLLTGELEKWHIGVLLYMYHLVVLTINSHTYSLTLWHTVQPVNFADKILRFGNFSLFCGFNLCDFCSAA